MHLVCRDFPSSTSLPAAVFRLDAGRGYRWHYKQRLTKVPVEPEPPADLPPPALSASHLWLLVELYFDGSKVFSHALKGAELTQLLRSGSACIPTAESSWTREVPLLIDLDHGCWSGWGLEFLDVDYDLVDPPIQVSKWSASVHLMRLTDFKTCCLFDATSQVDAEEEFWSGRGEALGRAWTSTPNTFDARSPYERGVDLIEGGMFEMERERLPIDERKLSPLVNAHMRAREVQGLGFTLTLMLALTLPREPHRLGFVSSHTFTLLPGPDLALTLTRTQSSAQVLGLGFFVSPTFKLPSSPRSFVYEKLVEGVTVKCENASNLWMNTLRRILTRNWQALDDQTVWQAAVDAGMSPSVSVSELLSDPPVLSGPLTMSELRLSFGELDHDGINLWCGSNEDDGDVLLLHMLDALVWK